MSHNLLEHFRERLPHSTPLYRKVGCVECRIWHSLHCSSRSSIVQTRFLKYYTNLTNKSYTQILLFIT